MATVENLKSRSVKLKVALQKSLAELESITEELLKMEDEKKPSLNQNYITEDEFRQAVGGISKTTMYRWVKEGRVNVVSLAKGHRFVRRTELERILNEAEARQVA